MTFKKITGLIFLANFTWCSHVHAGLEDLEFTTDVERQSAQIVLQTYSDLIAGAGCYDDMIAPELAGQVTGRALCDGNTYQIFTKMREIVHTANEISGFEEPTQFSLGFDIDGLTQALRWVAPEEYAAQKSLSRDFIKEQLSGLGARVTALRLGATGFSGINTQSFVNNQNRLTGGGASADRKDNTDEFSRVGGFINFSFNDGSKSATDLEDAFGFDGLRLNGCMDYRANQHWVVGAMVGYSDQTVDFNRSKSTADGTVNTDGFSFMPFVLFQNENFYASVSIGTQKQHFETTRIIFYPGTDEQTSSKTNSQILTSSAEFGYSIQFNQFTLEPFANFNSSATDIDKFVEVDKTNSALNVAVNGQKVKAIMYGLGMNLRYTFTPSFGVVTPFASIQQLSQINEEQHVIASRYVNAGGNATAFQLPGDKTDHYYRVIAVGVSSVLRGAQESTVGGVAAGGLQGFVHYKILDGLQDYTMRTIEMGLRYEF